MISMRSMLASGTLLRSGPACDGWLRRRPSTSTSVLFAAFSPKPRRLIAARLPSPMMSRICMPAWLRNTSINELAADSSICLRSITLTLAGAGALSGVARVITRGGNSYSLVSLAARLMLGAKATAKARRGNCIQVNPQKWVEPFEEGRNKRKRQAAALDGAALRNTSRIG